MTNIFLILVAAIIIGIIIVVLQRRWERNSSSHQMMSSPSLPSNIANDRASYLVGDSELQRFLAQGQKIQAIKRVRELTQMSLQEAKDYVEALAHRESLPAPSFAPITDALPAEVEQEARRLLADRNKIEAIKRVRELTAMSLKEAKDYVEALAYGEPLPDPSSTPVKSASSIEVEQEARRVLADKNKIEAIKRVRELTHMSLKEVKEFVESLEDKGMGNL